MRISDRHQTRRFGRNGAFSYTGAGSNLLTARCFVGVCSADRFGQDGLRFISG